MAGRQANWWLNWHQLEESKGEIQIFLCLGLYDFQIILQANDLAEMISLCIGLSAFGIAAQKMATFRIDLQTAWQ